MLKFSQKREERYRIEACFQLVHDNTLHFLKLHLILSIIVWAELSNWFMNWFIYGQVWSIIDNWISGFLLFMWFFNYVSTNSDSSDTENWSWKWKNHILMKRKPALRLSQINIISQTKFKSTKENNVHRRGPPRPFSCSVSALWSGAVSTQKN